jgi:small subunit ribosomal protein S6
VADYAYGWEHLFGRYPEPRLVADGSATLLPSVGFTLLLPPRGPLQSRGGDMRKYEVMLILDPSLEDKDAKAAIDRYLKTITSRDGKVLEVDHWGKRRFAYEIRHLNEGYYSVVTVEAETETVDEFARVLGLADNVIRHKVVRPEAA